MNTHIGPGAQLEVYRRTADGEECIEAQLVQFLAEGAIVLTDSGKVSLVSYRNIRIPPQAPRANKIQAVFRNGLLESVNAEGQMPTFEMVFYDHPETNASDADGEPVYVENAGMGSSIVIGHELMQLFPVQEED